jgi:hypothetical protein
VELEEWLNQNGLQVMNPDRVPTWVGLREGNRPSIIDLAFTNEAAIFTNQLSPLDVSLGESLGSDLAALLFQIYPLTHLALQPPPAPTGYHAIPKRCDSWMRAFLTAYAYDLLGASTCDLPSDHGNMTVHGVMVHKFLKRVNRAIKEASHKMLEPKWVPDPRGVTWWNNACSMAYTLAWTAQSGPKRKQAAKNLQRTITGTKRERAHERLHKVVDAKDVWSMVKMRKGRTTNTFPPLRDTTNRLVDKLEDKANVFCDKFFPSMPLIVVT